MKKQILLLAGLLAGFFFFSLPSIDAQQSNNTWQRQQQQQRSAEHYPIGQQQGPVETNISCGGNQYTLICNQTILTLLGSQNNDNIKLMSGSLSSDRDFLRCRPIHPDEADTYSVYLADACPTAIEVHAFLYNGNDRLDASSLSLPVTVEGQGGNDKIKGSNQDDEIKGGPGNDHIWGLDGDDNIEGNDGNDKIDGGAGNDIIYGGRHNDELFADPDDWVSPYDTNINLNEHVDQLNGGPNNDCLWGIKSFDVLKGGGGNDHISGSGLLEGNGEDDRLWLSYCPPAPSADGYYYGDIEVSTNILGGAGSDRIEKNSRCAEHPIGGEGNDYLGAFFNEGDQSLTDRGVAGENNVYVFGEGRVRYYSDTELTYRNCASESFCRASFFQPRACVRPDWEE